MMRVVVFGAAGRTGRLVVQKALGHGHLVLAALHENPLQIEHASLTKRVGDVCDLEFARSVMPDADAVIYALSSGGGHEVLRAGIANVIHAMAEQDVTKLVALSAAGAFARSDRRLSIGFRLRIATTLRATYDDLEAMEQRIAATDFDWTIVRPYGLDDSSPTGHYRIALDGSLLPNAARISRSDVASVLVKAAETETFYRRTLVVAD
jgi:putative NADH-flavin reductase